MSDCVFCKIRDGQIPSMMIYEDDRTLCIMDINPLNAGHCLVITQNHATTLFDSDPADLRGEGVRDVVAVEIHGRDDVVLGGT